MQASDLVFSEVRKYALRKAKKSVQAPVPKIEDAQKIRMQNPDNDRFSVGFCTCDITPENLTTHPYWIAGHGIAHRITGQLDPITASAMWLDCGDGQGMVLVSCDLIGLTGFEVQQIREGLSDFCAETGCKNVTVSCTHTHAGVDTMGYWGVLPKSGKDAVYMRRLLQTIIHLCKNAYKTRKTGKLYYGHTQAPELCFRWRKPDFTKPTLHRLRFVPDDGSAETWYLNFPAHPNTLGGKNRLLSADYVCYMRHEINRTKKVNVLFAVSAIGATDISCHSNLEDTLVCGTKLGQKALEITDERQLMPDITLAAQEFVMPIDNFVLSLANTLGVFNARRCAADSETGCGFISEITYISIDGVQILTMPGEMFPELVWDGGYCDAETSATGEAADVNPEPLSKIFNDNNLLIFGVTNDMAGYAIAVNDFVLDEKMPYFHRGRDRFDRSHYHETNSCGIRTGEVIAEACRRIRRILDAD